MNRTLEVWLGDTRVGLLRSLAGDLNFFEFSTDYLEDPRRPVLSQSFLKAYGELIPATRTARVKLPPFFSNLLPEGHLRQYLARRGGVKSEREFPLLELLGDDLPGAVTVRDTEPPDLPVDTDHDVEPGETDNPYRFSLAGVQLKFSAIAESAGGLTVPADGVGGDWIVKLPSLNFPQVPENEWAMLHLANHSGIPVPETRLIPLDNIDGLPELGALNEKTALAVKRFDRDSNRGRIHIEDLAQAYNLYPNNKYGRVSYANIAHLLWTLTGETGLIDFIRRLAFTVITGNGDMHLKNWSLIYPDGRTAALAPAYDLVATVAYTPNVNLALTLAGTKNMQAVTTEHFRKLARKAGLPERLVLQTVKDTVEATLAAWQAHHRHYGLSDNILERIQKHMRSLAIINLKNSG